MKTTPCNGPNHHLNACYAFNLAPRCGAKTRTGAPCKSPAIRFKQRCRMHGGNGSGAPRRNQNAFKHGYNTKIVRMHRREIKELLADHRDICTMLNAKSK